MPKINKYGGASVAGITDTATGQTATGKGFVEDTDATQVEAAARASSDPTGEGYTDTGAAVGADPADESGLVAGGEAADRTEPPFDPGQLSVADVNALLESASPAEREAVLAAERKDKNRKGIVGE